MSMKWIGCRNHNLQHVASEKLDETLQWLLLWCETNLGWILVITTATVEGAETHYIYVK
jgi:hypothetical protein